MIFLLDADGPLLDLTAASVRGVNEHFGTKYRADHWQDWHGTFMEPDQHRWMRTVLWCDDRFWAELPATPGAHNGVALLRAAGHEIRVVTSAFESCHLWDRARRHALHRHFLIPHGHVTITAEKHRIYGDVFVDDRVENVQGWLEHWAGFGLHRRHSHDRGAYLFDMPHNQASGAGFSRIDWKRIVEVFG